MGLAFTIRTIFETILVVALIWGIFNEHKLIAFEKHIIALIKRNRLKVVKSTSSYRAVRGNIYYLSKD